MRPVVYYVATTVDGYIARPDGSFDDFPMDETYLAALLAEIPETFPAHLRPAGATRRDNRRFDAVLMGRTTYEVGLRVGVSSPYPTLDQYVVSTTMTASPDPEVTLVRDSVVDAVSRLKAGPGKAIWLCGGARLAATLFSAGLVDEVVLKLNPVMFGSGIPLVGRGIDRTRLRWKDTFVHPSGHVRLHYAVLN
jgi:dihydrofolate reductase